jgi:hypothetical protein
MRIGIIEVAISDGLKVKSIARIALSLAVDALDVRAAYDTKPVPLAVDGGAVYKPRARRTAD